MGILVGWAHQGGGQQPTSGSAWKRAARTHPGRQTGSRKQELVWAEAPSPWHEWCPVRLTKHKFTEKIKGLNMVAKNIKPQARGPLRSVESSGSALVTCPGNDLKPLASIKTKHSLLWLLIQQGPLWKIKNIIFYKGVFIGTWKKLKGWNNFLVWNSIICTKSKGGNVE